MVALKDGIQSAEAIARLPRRALSGPRRLSPPISPAREPRSAAGQARLPGARELPAGPEPDRQGSARAAQPMRSIWSRAPSSRRAASISPSCRKALRFPAIFRRRRTQEFDRADRRVHPGHRRPVPGIRCGRMRAMRGRSMPEISPRTFPVLVRTGTRLSQLRLRKGEVRLSDAELHRLHRASDRHLGRSRRSRTGLRSASTSPGFGPDNLIGYRAKRHTGSSTWISRAPAGPPIIWEPLYADPAPVPDPRSGPVLHPRLQGGRSRAAGLRRRDGAVRSPGRRVPRPLRRVLRSRLRPRRGRRRGGPRRCSKCAPATSPSSWRTARSSGVSSTSAWPSGPKVLYGSGLDPITRPRVSSSPSISADTAYRRAPQRTLMRRWPAIVGRRGCSSEVERQLPKLNVVGSIPIARSKNFSL